MTTTQPALPKSSPARRGNAGNTGNSRARRDQLIAGALALASMVGIFALQPAIKSRRADLVPHTDSNLRQLAADFPRLTLGGFRGFLAPFLWQRAEELKNERQWHELGTLYNLIAKLEPYFVSVYIFNGWNEAYNLSAQWHSIDRKYQWVLRGLDYLYDGEYYNPNHPDILYEISQMYFMKIGNSYERITYRQMWRDNLAHQYEVPEDVTATADKFDVHRLVRAFILKPHFNVELLENPSDPRDTRKGHGIKIKGLLKNPDEFVEYPDGVSPFYFSYKEYQRTLDTAERMATPVSITSPIVVKAYPAMSLRLWCRDDAYYATNLVEDMFVKDPALYAYTDPNAPTARAFDQKVREIRRCFKNIEEIAGPKAIEGFDNYLIWFKNTQNRDNTIHPKHRLEVKYVMAIARAESELFEALVAWHTSQEPASNGVKPLTPQARTRLQAAVSKYDEAIAAVQTYLDQIYPDPNSYDREDHAKWQNALRVRQDGIRKWLTAEPNTRPDLAFLAQDTIER